jgi:hypothetical protein
VLRQVTHVSDRPLWWGSTDDFSILYPRYFGWQPIDVFPAGLMPDGDDWFCTMGVNDSFTALVRLTNEDLHLIPVGEIPAEAPAHLAPAGMAAPAGSVKVRSASRQPILEPGGPYNQGDEFLLTPDRAWALGKQIEVVA